MANRAFPGLLIDRERFGGSSDRPPCGNWGPPMHPENSESRDGEPVMPGPAAGEKPVATTASILVVDDVSANLQVLTGMLKARGYKVRPVPSGELALLAVRKAPPDLILLDINMPGMNGYEVCQHLKDDDTLRAIPVIFISALNDNLDKVKAFAIGGVDYITKPFQMEELHARVETHLNLRRLQVELEETNSRLVSANGRMSRDLEAAAKIQKTFLPCAAPRVPGTEFAWCYRPCDELAGDGLNIIPLGGGRVGLYVLDVSGHGVSSALLSVTLSRLLSPPSEPSSILVRDRDVLDWPDVTPPAEVADRLNRLFPYDTATEQFATLIYGVLDVSTGDYRHVSAGHPGPLHLPAGGPPVILENSGFPIGLAEEAYGERCVHLAEGDRLYLYSDGLPDAMNPGGERFGDARLLEAIGRVRAEPLREGFATLLGEISRWHGGERPQDDISILAVELAAAPNPVRSVGTPGREGRSSMGVAFFIVPEREVPGLETFVNGKALARAEDLDQVAEAAGVRPLMDFFSEDPEEVWALLSDEGSEPPAEGFAPQEWFPAEEGLATVRSLIAHLETDPSAAPDAAALVEDLREFDRVLGGLAAESVRWHLAVDL